MLSLWFLLRVSRFRGLSSPSFESKTTGTPICAQKVKTSKSNTQAATFHWIFFKRHCSRWIFVMKSFTISNKSLHTVKLTHESSFIGGLQTHPHHSMNFEEKWKKKNCLYFYTEHNVIISHNLSTTYSVARALWSFQVLVLKWLYLLTFMYIQHTLLIVFHCTILLCILCECVCILSYQSNCK